MKKRLLSLIACALITCNFITSISYAAEVEDVVENEQEISEEETTEVVEDTDVEPIEQLDSIEDIFVEELLEEKVDEEEERQKEASVEEDNLLIEEEVEDPAEEFVVTFVDSIDDKEFVTFFVNKGASVDELPEAPFHEGYVFEKYSGNYTNVMADETVTATYSLIEKANELTYKELSCDLDEYSISVTGYMPDDTKLQASIISNNEAEEQVEAEVNGTFKAEVTFDIKLISEGTVYQPTDFDEEVKVSIKGIDSSKNLDVFRITEDGTVTDMQAVDSGDEVSFETDHFTTYTVGDISYTSSDEGIWLGMNYANYDTDGDGVVETCVLTGTQTEKCTGIETIGRGGKYNPSHNAPYYSSVKSEGTITKIIVNAKLINGRNLFREACKTTYIDLSKADLSEVTDMHLMFAVCVNLEEIRWPEDLDTSKVTDMSLMFMSTFSFKNMDFLTKFNTSSVTNMSRMFECTSTDRKVNYFDIDLSTWDTSKVVDMSGMFARNLQFTGINMTGWDTSKVTDMSAMFSSCRSLNNLDISSFDTANVTNMRYFLALLENIDVRFDKEKFNTSKVTDMSSMFRMTKITNIQEIVSSLDTSSVIDMSEMFHATDYTLIDISGFNTSNVTNMSSMFSSSSIEEIDLSMLDTSKVEKINLMFQGAKLKSLDISNNNFSSVDNFSGLCRNCSELTYLNISSLPENAGQRYDGFGDCEKLAIIDMYPQTEEGYSQRITSDSEQMWYLDDNKDGIPDSTSQYRKTIADGEFHRYIRMGSVSFYVKGKKISNEFLWGTNPEIPEIPEKYLSMGEEIQDWYMAEPYWIIPNPVTKGKLYDFKTPIYRNSFELYANVVQAHKISEKQENYIAPSCTEMGSVELVTYCEDCNKVFKRETITLYPTGHFSGHCVEQNRSEPTCIEDGSYDWTCYCAICGEIKSLEHYIIPATGHTPGEAIVDNKENATHTKDGHYDSVINCKDCGKELSRETITIPATDHNPATAVVENRVEPTCTEAGHYDSVIYCKDDGDELSRTTVELEPTGHVGSNAVKENIVNATEDEEGSYEEVVYCAHCNKELSRESKTIAKIEVIIPVPSEPTDPVDPIIPDKPSTEDNTPENPSDEEPSNPIEAIEEEPQEIEEELETEEEVVLTISTDRTGSYSAGSEDDLEFKTVEIIAMAEDEDIDNNAETKTVTVKEPEEESDEIAEVIKAVVVTLSVAGSTGGIFFVFIWFRRRKVKGKILSKDGIDYAGCLVTLEGKDKLRTRTNKNGEFTFRNLKKDTYVLTVFNESKEILFSCELLLSNKNSANSVPNVLENNALSYQYAVAGASYILDIFA